MFLAGDESKSKHLKVYGFLCIPISKLPDFEANAVRFRLNSNTGAWAEIDWKSIPNIEGKRLNDYKNFLKMFFDESDAYYHCIITRKPSTNELRENDYLEKDIPEIRRTYLMRCCFMLIRSLCIMMQYCGIKEDLYIVGDSDNENNSEWPKINKYLKLDHKVKLNIIKCTYGKSHITNVHQLSDFLTGAISAKVNNKISNSSQKKLLGFIEENTGYEIGAEMPRTRWGTKKINSWRLIPVRKNSYFGS